MVEIIKEGSLDNLAKNKWYRFTCRDCRCEFKFQRYEAKEYWGDQREPASELWIACPQCKTTCRTQI